MAPRQTDPAGATDAAPEAVRRRIRERAAAIADRECRMAVDRLEARGDLTDEQRAVVADLAAAIVDGVLTGPEAALDEAADADREVGRTAIELFAPDR